MSYLFSSQRLSNDLPSNGTFAMAFENVFCGKKVRVTGHTGFKGSWLTVWLADLGVEVVGLSKGIPSCPSHFLAANVGNVGGVLSVLAYSRGKSSGYDVVDLSEKDKLEDVRFLKIDGSKLIGERSQYADSDPRCCPSRTVTVEYDVMSEEIRERN